jgi:hypothetical protein
MVFLEMGLNAQDEKEPEALWILDRKRELGKTGKNLHKERSIYIGLENKQTE